MTALHSALRVFALWMAPVYLVCLVCLVGFASAPALALAPALAPALAVSTESNTPEVRVQLEYARANATALAVVWLHIRSDYYAYAHTPGPVGKPTTLAVKGAKGTALPVYYVPGVLRNDLFEPGKTIAAYTGEVPIFVDMTLAGGALTAHLDLLLCSDKHCLPVQQEVSLLLPQGELAPLSASAKNYWQSAQKGAPVPENIQADTPVMTIAPQWVFSPRPVQAHLEVRSLGKALLLGLLAGLLLNVMPCVLPVLTLKASATLLVGSGDRATRLRSFREHNLLFAGGILTQFILLSLLLGSAGLIWGQIFQSTVLVTAMLIVVFLLGLSMLGLFTLPVIDLKAGQSASPRVNAYLTGIMATLLATPCSGPLLGGVLGWAFMQPLPVLVVVFLAVGVGMSIPYLIFAVWPQVALILPRPGPWMEVLERGVGFFLLGTSLYLLSILPQDRHLPLLAALLVVALGGWIWGYFGGLNAPVMRRRILGLGLAALTLVVVFFASRPPDPMPIWEPFTPAAFQEILGQEPMLVEFTADWCPNCKFLEQAVLTQERLRRWQRRYGFRLMRVDLTRENASATELLQAVGGSSIPLTALFPRGLMSSTPFILRDIYTADMLEKAMEQAFSPQK